MLPSRCISQGKKKAKTESYVEQTVNDNDIFPKTESTALTAVKPIPNKGGKRRRREKSANQSNSLLLK